MIRLDVEVLDQGGTAPARTPVVRRQRGPDLGRSTVCIATSAIPDTVQVKADYDGGKVVKIGSFAVPASTIDGDPW